VADRPPGWDKVEWAYELRRLTAQVAALEARLKALEDRQSEGRGFRRALTVAALTVALTLLSGFILAVVHLN
jgi:hypothetical protein